MSAVRRTGLSLLACAAMSACPPAEGGSSDAAVAETDAAAILDGGAAEDGGRTRRFWLASTGVVAVPYAEPDLFQVTEADLAADADAVAVFAEFWGIPWAEFAAGSEPPAPWVQLVQGAAARAKSLGKPIFLSMALGRGSLVDRTAVSNGRLTKEGWAGCYDFAADPSGVRAAYPRYVGWMVQQFQPRWVNHAVEISLHAQACPSQWSATIPVLQEAYDAAKASAPAAVVFPSFQLEHLYGLEAASCGAPKTAQECFDEKWAQVAPLKRDRIGVSTYPIAHYGLDKPALPADWFTRVATRNPSAPERVIVAETGWNTETLTLQLPDGGCSAAAPSDEPTAAAYLARLAADAQGQGIELVTWWSDRDLLPAGFLPDCGCHQTAEWCAVRNAFGTALGVPGGELTLKAYGAMGIRDHVGTPKPQLMGVWTSLRAPEIQARP